MALSKSLQRDCGIFMNPTCIVSVFDFIVLCKWVGDCGYLGSLSSAYVIEDYSLFPHSHFWDFILKILFVLYNFV